MLSPLGRLCQIFAECQHHPEGPSRGVQSQLCSTVTTHQQAACWETPQTFTGFFKYAWEPHQRVPEVSLPCSYRTCRGWCNYTGIHAAMATCASHWSLEMRVIKIQITADINFSIPQGFVWLSPALTLILFPILLCSGFAFTLSPSWGCACVMTPPVFSSLVVKVEGTASHTGDVFLNQCVYVLGWIWKWIHRVEKDSLIHSASDPKRKGNKESCLNMKKVKIFLWRTHGTPPLITVYFQTSPSSVCQYDLPFLVFLLRSLTQRNKMECSLQELFPNCCIFFSEALSRSREQPSVRVSMD